MRCQRIKTASLELAKAALPFQVKTMTDLYSGDEIPIESVGDDYEVSYDSPPTVADCKRLNKAVRDCLLALKG